ncbi:unnamed protein product [Meganyctiphanes norvegica]|uniref:Uncharacterized protein n=1 Tax=Meganyctiphanes norvegica TaxID=48144 RepID=A0AAV2S5P3_MEGNR
MDTLLAQLQRQVKRDLEPLKVTLTPAKKNTKNEKNNDRKKTRKNAKRDEKDQKNKNRKINRDPKDISLPEIEDVEEEIHQVQRREAEAEEEFSGRRNNNDKNKEKKDKDNKNKNNRKNNNKKNNKNKKQNKNKNNKRQARSNKVVLHGLSNIAREGDVDLYNMKNGRALVTDFSIGPVELDITRNFGSDKDAEERKASASANKLNGKLMIKINKEGKPRIKKLKLNRPKDITMSGSVARSHDDKSVGFFKKSVKQVAPTAAKKLLKAAKAIIKTV